MRHGWELLAGAIGHSQDAPELHADEWTGVGAGLLACVGALDAGAPDGDGALAQRWRASSAICSNAARGFTGP